MKIMKILHDSVVDGDGLRTVIFFAGCPHSCPGCHNPSSWNMSNGMEMSLYEVMEEIKSNPLTNVTFSGGEPFIQAQEAVCLAKEIKELGKNIWVYSGFTYEEIIHSNDPYKSKLIELCDFLVDGRFLIAERDLSLSFRGSRNQRIISLSQINGK